MSWTEEELVFISRVSRLVDRGDIPAGITKTDLRRVLQGEQLSVICPLGSRKTAGKNEPVARSERDDELVALQKTDLSGSRSVKERPVETKEEAKEPSDG